MLRVSGWPVTKLMMVVDVFGLYMYIYIYLRPPDIEFLPCSGARVWTMDAIFRLLKAPDVDERTRRGDRVLLELLARVADAELGSMFPKKPALEAA